MRHSMCRSLLGLTCFAILVLGIACVSFAQPGRGAAIDVQSDAEILGQNPKNVTARVELIQADINSANYAQAESLADEGVKLLPNEARLWSARGAAYYNDGLTKRSSGSPATEELRMAADSYDQALKLDPNAAPGNVVAAAFAQYGLLLWQNQQYRQCIPYAEKAANMYAKAWQYRMLKGDCESGAENFKAAVGDYQIAEQGDDKSQPALSSRLLAALGNAQLRMGDETGGLQSMKSAEQLAPSVPYPYQAVASYYITKNPPNLNAALDPLLHLAQLQPDNAQVQINIGDISLRQGNLAQSGAAFAKAIQIDPHNPDAQFGLAELAATQGDITSLDRELQKAVALNPTDASFYNATIAEMLLAPAINPQSAHTYAGGGNYVGQSQRDAYAQKYAEAATKADPNDGAAWYQLGVAYAQQLKRDLASAALRKAFKIFTSKSCVAVHFVGRTGSGSGSCLDYQRTMMIQTDQAYMQLNGKDATLMASQGKGGGTGKDITTNGDMPH